MPTVRLPWSLASSLYHATQGVVSTPRASLADRPRGGLLREYVQSRTSEFTSVERVDERAGGDDRSTSDVNRVDVVPHLCERVGVEQLSRLGRQRRLDGDEIHTGEQFFKVDRGGGVVGHVLAVKERVADKRVDTESGGTLADRATVTVDSETP